MCNTSVIFNTSVGPLIHLLYTIICDFISLGLLLIYNILFTLYIFFKDTFVYLLFLFSFFLLQLLWFLFLYAFFIVMLLCGCNTTFPCRGTSKVLSNLILSYDIFLEPKKCLFCPTTKKQSIKTSEILKSCRQKHTLSFFYLYLVVSIWLY